MTQTAEILILSRNPEHVQQWTRLLSGENTHLWQDADEIPSRTSIDLIVTDAVLTDDRLTDSQIQAGLAACEIAVVGIGSANRADVCLPVEFTARELQTACRLLIQIVRLRRERNQNRKTQDALRRMAMTDPLTGLPNRRAWDDELQGYRPSAKRRANCLCLALLDLDHFKMVNSQFGHMVGDRLLQYVGCRLSEAVVLPHFSARLGGDEFAIILNGPQPEGFAAKIEDIRVSVCQGAPTPITASVGFAVDEGPSAGSSDALLASADAALRRAKLAGRNCGVAAIPLDEAEGLTGPQNQE